MPRDSEHFPSEEVLKRGTSLVVDRTTTEVFGALRNAGVRALLLKGPAIARWLYAPSYLRSYSDTDVLVAPDDVGRAEEILTSLGFELPPIYDEDDRPSFEHAWVRRSDGVRVDLHWNLVGSTVQDDEAWTVLSSDSEAMEIEGEEVEVLGETARMVHVSLHAAQHGSEMGKALEDLRRAVARFDAERWREAAEIADALGADLSFAAGLRLDPAGEALANEIGLSHELSVEVALRAQGGAGHALSLQWLLEQPGVWRKVKVVGKNLVPPPTFMRDWHPLASRGWAGLALAYLWRPLFLLGKLGTSIPVLLRARREAKRASGRK